MRAIGHDAELNEQPETSAVGGKDATVFARLAFTDPRRVGDETAPKMVLVFAHRYNSQSTDGFVIGCVATAAPRVDTLWPLRWMRFRNISPSTVADIIGSLIAEAIFAEL